MVSVPALGPAQNAEERAVESVVKAARNGPLIATAAKLWIKPDDVVMDVTYGKGNFWTHYRPGHLIAHDLVTDGVDFRQLPEADASVNVVIFDPPYIAKGGRDTSTIPEFLDRYGLYAAPRTPAEMMEQNAAGMKEAARVLRPGGILMVKCMDYVSSRRLVIARHHVVNTALALGMEQVDEFIHYSGTGPQPKGRKQEHSRRAHSYLCVFELLKRARKSPHFDGHEEREWITCCCGYVSSNLTALRRHIKAARALNIDRCHLCGGRGSFGPNAEGQVLACPCQTAQIDGSDD